ncbi:MAG: Spy/CpxP family protein refolding chaperone [Methyloceanibacter sp.]|jgi:hypothetical protein
MHYPLKIASILVVAVLALTSLTLLTTAWGDTPGKNPMRTAWAGHERGHHGRMPRCNRPGPDRAAMPHGPGWRGPDRLAAKLSAMETEIGIRANQLDAWRDFTDALLATMKRPSHPMRTGPGAATSDENAPFSLAERFADNAIARGQSGEALKKAIGALRSTLTPDQLDKVKAIEARFRSMHGGPRSFGPPHHGAGAEPDAGPSDAPDAPDTPDAPDAPDAPDKDDSL